MNSILSTIIRLRNKFTTSDRVIIENVFGREIALRCLQYPQHKLTEELYDKVVTVCRCQTNSHVTRHTLKVVDNAPYQYWHCRAFELRQERHMKRRLDQRLSGSKKKAYRRRARSAGTMWIGHNVWEQRH